jgi:Protein of unknown function (DUF1214)
VLAQLGLINAATLPVCGADTPGRRSTRQRAHPPRKHGDWLDGSKTYRLRVPPKAPVKQFWSLTVYDVNTRALIQNKEQRWNAVAIRFRTAARADERFTVSIKRTAAPPHEPVLRVRVAAEVRIAQVQLRAPRQGREFVPRLDIPGGSFDPPIDRFVSFQGELERTRRFRFARDSPLEEGRFELAVPPRWRAQPARRFSRYLRRRTCDDS